MQKVEKLIDVATEALTIYIRTAGQTVSGGEITAAEVKTRKPRVGKEKAPETAAASPFDTGAQEQPAGKPAAAASKLNPEDALEAGRRGQEVMGLFIRRFLKANPTGLERAKKIVNETLGLPRVPATAWKLEDFTPEDWLKLTPKFEAELDKAELDKADAK